MVADGGQADTPRRRDVPGGGAAVALLVRQRLAPASRSSRFPMAAATPGWTDVSALCDTMTAQDETDRRTYRHSDTRLTVRTSLPR